MEQRVVLAGIPQPRKVLHDPVVGAREQVGVSPCPEALEPGALRLGWNAGPPRTELARRSDANDLAPQHICGIPRSEEHTSESSHSQISYAVFCLKKKNKILPTIYHFSQHPAYHTFSRSPPIAYARHRITLPHR